MVRARSRGFTYIELMVVLGVAAVLATLSVQALGKYIQNAKRAEARQGLAGIYDAQHVYMHENLQYAATFDQLNFSFHGGTRISATTIKGKRYTYRLSQPNGPLSWYCSATGNIDDDEWPDVLVMEVGTQDAE